MRSGGADQTLKGVVPVIHEIEGTMKHLDFTLVRYLAIYAITAYENIADRSI